MIIFYNRGDYDQNSIFCWSFFQNHKTIKKIGLISDTHGFVDLKVAEYFKDCDQIWHAGDIGPNDVIPKLERIAPVIAVQGNIDDAEIRQQFPVDQFFKCEDVNVWITHIGGYPGRYSKHARDYLAKNPTPDIFITGHSHILKVMRDKKYNLLHLNPGAAGYYGFHKVKTLLRFEIAGNKISKLEVIELGKRGKI